MLFEAYLIAKSECQLLTEQVNRLPTHVELVERRPGILARALNALRRVEQPSGPWIERWPEQA